MPWYWRHQSAIPTHRNDADIDCARADHPVRDFVLADVDDDCSDEVIALITSPGSLGNDVWVMDYDHDAHSWRHLSPISGHALSASIDCSSAPAPAVAVAAGDFDGDGVAEVAFAVGAPWVNEFWVVKYDKDASTWIHMSPVEGSSFGSDLRCTPKELASGRFAAGDFDGDGRDELAIAVGGGKQSAIWVMKYEGGRWRHLSPIAGDVLDADLRCSTKRAGTWILVPGDFDGDGRDELAVGIDAEASDGNDFWVMDCDASGWRHLGSIPGHGLDADIDCSRGSAPARWAVAGDVDGDGRDELIASIFEPDSSLGNDLWVMKYDHASGAWVHFSPISGHPANADIDCGTVDRATHALCVGDFDSDGVAEIAVSISALDARGNDFWVMDFDRSEGAWRHLSPIDGHNLGADVDCTAIGNPAARAFGGDVNGDGRDELVAVSFAPAGTQGNDFWVMQAHNPDFMPPGTKCFPPKEVDQGCKECLSDATDIQLVARTTYSEEKTPFPVSLGHLPCRIFGDCRELIELDFKGFTATNDGLTVTVTTTGGGRGSYESTGKVEIGFSVDIRGENGFGPFRGSAKGHADIVLTTESVTFDGSTISGSRHDRSTGRMRLVAADQMRGGDLNGYELLVEVDLTLLCTW